jgi:hypothetical protein
MAAKKRASGQKGKQAAGTARRKSRATTKRMTGVTVPQKGAVEKLGEAIRPYAPFAAYAEVAGNLMVPLKQIHDAYKMLNKPVRTTAKKKRSKKSSGR